MNGSTAGKPSKNGLKIQGRLVRSRVNDPAYHPVARFLLAYGHR